jgi:regulator of cell morphogenesis and NO signaling
MNNQITKSLAQIVNDNHKAASVFEKYDLDFCCKGKRSLQDACIEKSLPVEKLLSELQAVNDNCEVPVDFQKMTLTQLADYIVTKHHAYVKAEMPQIFSYLQKVATKHGDRHPEMRKVFELFSVIKSEMEEHMDKEELILFPRIEVAEEGALAEKTANMNVFYIQHPIQMMEAEHEKAGQLMTEIRELTGNYTPPNDACTTYRLSFAELRAFESDLHQHVHLENNILFPRAIELFQKATG